MKKLNMQEVNKNEQEFDRFVNSEHAEFICDIIGGLTIVMGAVIVAVGQYSKSIKNNKEEN